MNINKSGFLHIWDITEEKIIISKDTHVTLFDDGQYVKNIILEENAKVDYFGYFTGNNV